MARMKVFVFDPIAAGSAPPRPLPGTLRRQGEMLFQALLADLGALSGVEVVTTASPGPASGQAPHLESGPAAWMAAGSDEGLTKDGAEWAPSAARTDTPPGAQPALDTALQALPGLRQDAHRFGEQFAAGLQAVDAVWPLASETGGVLQQLSRGILRGKRILLGSAPGAVEVAASKLKLAQVLAEGGVAAVATYSPHAALPRDGGPWVVKPDDGAGCLDTRLFSDRSAALAWIRANAADSYVLQPFVAGKLGSLSLICCDGTARVLACNQERVAMRDNRFHFLGSVVNGLSDADGMLARLAQQVAAAIPSLWGYVGVDFVLTAQGALVLDVNPRLTAAYAGLHASTGCNPAGLVLDLLKSPTTMGAPVGMRRAVSVDVGTP
jgi:predicted ATP-grasp superfamily ATP-dependent carboligase